MRVTFDQCDSTEEIVGLFNKVFANQEQLNTKITQNAREIEALKPKKKGKDKMKSKGSASMRVIAMVLIMAIAGFCYAAYVPSDINYDIASNPESLTTYLRDVTGNMQSDSYLFAPTLAADAPPFADGRVWYNNTANILQISLDGTTWTNIALAGGNSLDVAYDVAEEITVDSGTPVTFTVPDGGNNAGLLITSNDTTNDPDTLVIDQNSDLATVTAIQIDTVAGYDIRGTGDAWYVSRLGVATLPGIILGGTDLTMENADGINNVDDDVIEFWTNDAEVFESDHSNADSILFASDTAADEWDFGDVDDLVGVGNLDFDDAATAITQTGTGTNDLTITQAGVTTQSLILNSDGNVDDAITITTLGGIDVDTTLSIVLTSVENTADSIVLQSTIGGIDILCDAAGAAEDIDIANTGGSVHIVASEAATDAVNIDATGADGGIDLDTTNGPITLTTAGVANGDMTLTVADAFTLTSTDTAQNGIHIEANGGTAESINLYSNQGTGASATTEHDASIQLQSDAGGISLYTTGDVADAIRLETNGGVDEFITINNLQGTGTDAITITANAAGGDVDINSILGSIFIEAEEDSATAISIIADGVAASGGIWIQNETGTSVTEDTAAIEIRATLGGIAIQSDANLDDCIVIRADGGTTSEITITNDQGDTADSIELTSAAGGITLSCVAGTSVVFTAGQTRTITPVVVVDGTVPPATTAIGTSGQSQIPVYSFDANPDATGDDYVFLLWRVPAGYVVDSADLFFTFSYSTAETDGDDVCFDCTVLAITPGSGAAGGTAYDAAGSAVVALDVDLVNGDGDEGKVMEGTFDIEVTAIAAGDEVIIAFWVDEDQCDLAASGTVDIHNWTITYESTE